MRPSFIFLLVLSALHLSCIGQGQPTEEGRANSAIVDGSSDPTNLSLSISPYEQNAVGGLVDQYFGSDVQWCSATLIGDRVVYTAQHCVTANLIDHLVDGDPLEYLYPDEVEFFTGEKLDEPTCRIQAAEIHTAPGFVWNDEMSSLVHDVAVIILESSALELCGDTVPIPVNLSELGEEHEGGTAIVGGFGSIDGSHDYSQTRFWSVVSIDAIWDTHIHTLDAEEGFPTYGDSGSGLLSRFPDGQLRNLGVCSTGTLPYMDFPRADIDRDWFLSVVEREDLCGPIGDEGGCIDDYAVRCTEGGLEGLDCAAEELECVIDEVEGAICGDPAGPDPDAGPDAGSDAGPDAGADGGPDGSPEVDADSSEGDADVDEANGETDSDVSTPRSASGGGCSAAFVPSSTSWLVPLVL